MNVVVVVARGLRVDMLGCYGNLWIETPNLDALAADGVLFDWHYSDNVEAWRSWLTGRYHFPEAGSTGTAAQSTLLEYFKAKGITTCLVREGRDATSTDEPLGWDRVVTVRLTAGQDALEQMLAAAEKSLKKLARRDGWLLWIELATTLPPWNVPPDFQATYFQPDEDDEEEADVDNDDEIEVEESENAAAKDDDEDVIPELLQPLPEPPLGRVDESDDTLYLRMQSSCAAAVSYLDAGIGLLREQVSRLRQGDSTIFLVTADAGFPLGEHGIVGLAGAPPHEELIHLPLLVCLPGEAEAGRRVAGLTQAVDLAPTLAEAFGLHAPDAHGHSLWPLLRGAAEQVRAYAVAAGAGYCLRTPDWALLTSSDATASTPQLYIKPEDRREVNDESQHHLEKVDYLERLLREFVAMTRQEGPLEPPALMETENRAE